MGPKPSYADLQRRVSSLEAAVVARDTEIETLRKTIERRDRQSSRLSADTLKTYKKTQKDLEKSQKLIQTLLNTIEGEAFIKDTEGTYLYVNRAFGDDFGVDPNEVIGKDDYYIFPEEAAKRLKENDRRIMAEGKPENVEESGSLNGRRLTYRTNKVPFFDDDGKILGICGIGFDISDQKKVERELQEARANLEKQVLERTAELSKTVTELRQAEWRYRTVADYTYDWEYWTNLDGSLNYVSPSCERISGYSPRQLIERPALLKEIVLPEDQKLWTSHHHESRAEHKAREIRFRIRHKNGSIRWIEHVCQPVIAENGELLGFRASNRDITRRKEGEEKLRHAYTEIKALKDQLEADSIYLREEIKLDHNYENIIGESEVMKYVLYSMKQIAPTDATVMILGESGTGKELVARAIHYNSKRKNRPLIKVDCASLPASLIESELFGHQRGAFTGAIEKRIGRFELANGATLFLDEIGELPLDLQKKLLRVLQDGEFERLGSTRSIRTDLRVIAATNRNLEKDVESGRFRKDLWYRLNVLPLSLPPLRERVDDIPLLVDSIVKRAQRRLGKQITTIPAAIIGQLKAYAWPGNVRELENIIERAVIFTKDETLQLAGPLKKPLTLRAPHPPDMPLKSLAEMEKAHILMALERTRWNVTGKGGAAELLGINPSTLRGRMRKHGIRRPGYHN